MIFIFRSYTTQLSDFHWPTAIVLLLVFVLFVGVFMYQMNQIQKSSVPYEDGVLLAPKELIFDDEGINDKTEYGTNIYQWQAVRRIEEHKGHIYIFLDKCWLRLFLQELWGVMKKKKSYLII